MFYKSVLLLSFLLGFNLSVKANFVFNNNSIAAYKAIYELKFNDAKKYIQDEKLRNPQNGITVLLDNYADYLHLLTSENKSEYEKLKDLKSDRIDAIEDNDENSPYYLFAQAEIYLQWGMLKAKFGDYTASTLDLNKAKKLLNENNKKYKDFLPNQKSLALLDVIFGAIPSNLRGIANFFGIRGDIASGYKQLEKFRTQIAGSSYSYYNDEAVFLLCFTDIDVLHSRNNYAHLAQLLDGMSDKSLLKVYLQGYVAYKTGHNDEAINYLQNAPKSTLYPALPAISYLLGNAKLCRMDTDANVYLLKFLKDTRGINYIKDSYQKLAYYYLLRNDLNNYNNYIKLTRTRGYATDEKDKQALKEANDVKPDLELLKARLYFDGGYYNNALVQLKSKQVNDLKNIRDKIELYYRFGRTYDRMNVFNDALINYQRAINIGKKETYYYAANSALFSGVIYEQKKDYKKAAEYYNQALQMKNHEYQNSIDTQAKEGLNRISQ